MSHLINLCLLEVFCIQSSNLPKTGISHLNESSLCYTRYVTENTIKFAPWYLKDYHRLEKSNKLWWLFTFEYATLKATTIIIHNFKARSLTWHLDYNTWTGLPFKELDIVLANRVAIVWSSWKRNLTKVKSIQNSLILFQKEEWKNTIWFKKYFLCTENSWSVLMVLMPKSDWQIEIKMLAIYFELKSAGKKLPQRCLCQTSSTRSNLLSSHQNGMCTVQCNNLQYEIYQSPHLAMRSYHFHLFAIPLIVKLYITCSSVTI